jgi:hypothetical protein
MVETFVLFEKAAQQPFSLTHISIDRCIEYTSSHAVTTMSHQSPQVSDTFCVVESMRYTAAALVEGRLARLDCHSTLDSFVDVVRCCSRCYSRQQAVILVWCVSSRMLSDL